MAESVYVVFWQTCHEDTYGKVVEMFHEHEHAEAFVNAKPNPEYLRIEQWLVKENFENDRT